MNVKIFCGTNVPDLEEEINEWFYARPDNLKTDIKFICQSESTQSLSISIFYTEA